MKIYLAGQSRNYAMIQALAESVQNRYPGFKWTCPWWGHIGPYNTLSPSEDPERLHRIRTLSQAARDDYKGIEEAQAVIVVYHYDVHAAGMWTELGIAMALGKPIMVLCLGLSTTAQENVTLALLRQNVFLARADHRVCYAFQDDTEDHLSRLAHEIIHWVANHCL